MLGWVVHGKTKNFDMIHELAKKEDNMAYLQVSMRKINGASLENKTHSSSL